IVISAPTLSDPSPRKPSPCDRATICDGSWLLIYPCADRSSSRPAKKNDETSPRTAPLSGEPLLPELYDLKTDSTCLHNVLDANREVARDLHQRFFAFLCRSSMRRDHLDYFRFWP